MNGKRMKDSDPKQDEPEMTIALVWELTPVSLGPVEPPARRENQAGEWQAAHMSSVGHAPLVLWRAYVHVEAKKVQMPK